MSKDNPDPKSVAVATLGCKVNQFDSAALQSGFVEQGATLVDFNQPADVYVINTCAVTAKAAAQSRQLIRRAQRANPRARIVVTGCYAQISPESIRKIIPATARIVDNSRKHLLVAAALTDAEQEESTAEPAAGDFGPAAKITLLPAKAFAGRTRAFLKIQDGCNNFCSYCIVPYARGRSRSLLPAEVLRQAEIFSAAGYREMVITGIHVGAYGQDLQPRRNLLDILSMLADHLPAIRFRISSLEPTEISAALLHFLAGAANVMPHLHVPLQSGDNGILRKMNRHYTAEDFAGIIREIRCQLPDAAIGVDVLTGFPGEDETAFCNTRSLLAGLPVTYLHVFPYSRRPGTVAATMDQQVDKAVKTERVAELRSLGAEKKAAFYTSQLGTVHQMLVEGATRHDRLRRGFTENYIPVSCEAPAAAANQLLRVRLTRLLADGTVYAEVLGVAEPAAGHSDNLSVTTQVDSL